MTNYQIIDDTGVIESGSLEEMQDIFYSEEIDFEWDGDLKLIEVIDVKR